MAGDQATAPPPIVPGSVGLLGGTFDPIHLGHLAAGEAAREELGLERVIFIPAGDPPHKAGPMASAEDRALMTQLAISGNPAFELSRIELDRPGPSFAVETVEEFTRQAEAFGRPAVFTFILSAEAFLGLPRWKDPMRLVDLARFVVVPRADVEPPSQGWVAEHFEGRTDRFTMLDRPHLAISSTEIRMRVAAGRSVRYLVPDAVCDYIAHHGLYRTSKDTAS
jgi:nicotinate-nucleotide adenylyltransferase